MSKAIGIFACLLIVALDVSAGLLGIKADMAQNQEKHLKLWIFECKEPSHKAYVLGVAASGLLLIAHVIANLVGGCKICTNDDQKASPSRQLSLACLVLTWLILIVGLSMLVIGTLSNSKSRASCGLNHRHFLSIGGVLCMVHSLFSVGYYVTVTAAE